jgi:hypothetical protein
MTQMLIEGYTLDEILNFPDELVKTFLPNAPIVLKAGSAEILGAVRIAHNRLVVELAQIDGGGEGVLPSLWILANRFAAKQNLSDVEWIVHAVDCAKPNLKLRRLLEKRGFVIENIDGVGKAYHFVHKI